MATYDQLPVYKATYGLLLGVFRVCQNMERGVKFTIGEKLKNEIIELQINVFRANCREDKCALLGAARENAEVARLLMRLLHDMQQIKLELFVNLNASLESISKQLAAWHKKGKQPVVQQIIEGF
jgi:hypothetical protein